MYVWFVVSLFVHVRVCMHTHVCVCMCVGGLCFKIQANIEQMKSPYLEKHFVVLEKHF